MPIFGTSYVRQDAHGAATSPERGEVNAFNGLKSAVSSHLGLSSLSDLTISITSRTGTYTNPKTGTLEEVDLLATKELRTAFEKYARTIPDSRRIMSDWGVSANCKGDQQGRRPLLKPSSVPPGDLDFEQELPNVIASFGSAKERHAAARRFIFVEQYLNKTREKIEGLITSKEKEIQSPTLPDAQAARLRKEIQDLKKLQNKLSSVDLYAIKTVLKHLPIGRANKEVLRQKEDEIKDAVFDDLEKGFFRKTPNAQEQDYAADVVGMLYQGRASYYEYAERAFRGHPKKEHVSDLFLREALLFGVKSEGEYDAKGFQDSVLLAEMGEDLRTELKSTLGGIGRVLSHAAEQDMPFFDYIEQTVPTGTPDDIKQMSQVAKMRASMAAHRKAIASKMGIDPASLPIRIVHPGMRTLAKTAAIITLGTLGARSAGVETASRVFGFARSHPVRAAAGVVLMDTLWPKVRALVCPPTRLPSGEVEEKLSYKRLALLASSAALVAYLGQAALTAAAPFLAASQAPGISPANMLMPTAPAMSGMAPPQVPGMLAQAGILGTLVAQRAGQVVDYVWRASYVPTGLGTWRIPLIGTWQGHIPTMAALHLSSSVTNSIPVVNRVSELALRPLMHVGSASTIAPAGQYFWQRATEQLGGDPISVLASRATMVMVAVQMWYTALWAINSFPIWT